MGRRPASAMPIAAPVMASSDSGVPKTRSGPYFASKPRVVPWIDLGSSTSRPKTSTAGSRAISWSVASRIASTYEIARGGATFRCAGLTVNGTAIHSPRSAANGRRGNLSIREYVLKQLTGLRIVAFRRVGEHCRDFGFHCILDALSLRRRHEPGDAPELVAFAPRPGFLCGPV